VLIVFCKKKKKKKRKVTSVFHASALLLTTDNEFLHNIVKVVCGSTVGLWLSPRGSTATLTMLWPDSWSIIRQTDKNWRQFVKQNLYMQSKSSHTIIQSLDVFTRRTCVTSTRAKGFGFYVSFWAHLKGSIGLRVLLGRVRECLCKSGPVDFAWDTNLAHFLCVVSHSFTYSKTTIRLIGSLYFSKFYGN